MPLISSRNVRTPRRFGRLAVIAAALGLVTLTAAPASAHAYDGADPAATGCSSGAVTVDQTSRDGMTFQLRWSSHCQTNWVRILNYPGTLSASQRDGLRMDVGDLHRGLLVQFVGDTTTTGTRWGNMVYSPSDNCAGGYVNYKVGGTNWAEHDLSLFSSTC
ncbi:DUF2690 domain-containing protein [Nocardiopsis halotolerans]|uniref:DUF2690 domain-containing protein n=1 Tax=Nocardiopsis halotolerans TaxID=124252 RepID=UPI00034790A8|nr:DUF2690 domain-containing protein [Nocardiopsis halotolerans]